MQSGLQLIKPNDGQLNWGPAINNNFQILANKYTSLNLAVESFKRKIEELDTLKIQSDSFIFIDNTLKMYICKVKESDLDEYTLSDVWNAIDNSSDDYIDKSLFNPESSIYFGYEAWFVKTQNDLTKTTSYNTQPYDWDTGDLLIVHKAATSTIIEQWKSIMGGYYEPVEYTPEDKGKLKVTLKRKPNIATNVEEEKYIPHIVWKPTSYTNIGGKLIMTPCWFTEEGEQIPVNQVDSVVLETGVSIRGTGNIRTINVTTSASFSENFSIIGAIGTVGYDVHFNDGNGNILYMCYTAAISGSSLTITVNPGTFRGSLTMRVNIYAQNA